MVDWYQLNWSVSIRIINMQLLLQNYSKLEAIIEHGSIMVPKAKYPFMTFLCGFLYNKISSIQKLFSTIESILYLSSQGKLNDLYQQQLLFMLFDKPHKYQEIHLLLEKLVNNQPIQLFLELQKLEKEDDSGNENQHQNLSKTKTIELENEQNDQSGDRILEEEIREMERRQKLDKQSLEFALRLQRQEEENAKKKEEDDAVCQICYVGLYESQFHPLENCQHIFHKDCLSEAFKAQISENKFPLKCANDTCQSEVKDNDIKQILQSENYLKYQRHTLKFYADLHGDSTSWCPTADCEYMFFFEKDDQTRFQCPQCKKQYCLNCRVEWHKDMSCKQFQITNTTSEDDLKFMNFVKGKKFKQCPRCKFWVEKNQGCDHMTCKCRFQFCYKCGGVYGKCECVEKAQADMRRRMELAEERRRKKQERKRNADNRKSSKPRRKGR